MDIRLNKLLSEAGICSRREADQFMETDRVTVNGKFPKMGQRVTAEDEVLVDGEKVNVEKYLQLQEEQRREEEEEKELIRSLHTFKADKLRLPAEEDRLLREALRPQFGKSLRKSAVAQRIAANPKSAALRKTSRNNPINKAKRAAQYKRRNNG